MKCLAFLLLAVFTSVSDAAESPRADAEGEPLPDGALFRFGSARFRHGGTIRNAALSPGGKWLATCGERSVVVWDAVTRKVVRRFPCAAWTSFVTPGIAFSPTGDRLVTIFGTDFASVWEVPTGKVVRRIEREHLGTLCQFTGDGKAIVLTDQRGLYFLDPDSGRESRLAETGPVRLLSPDGTLFLRPGNGALVLGDVATGKETLQLAVSSDQHAHIIGVALSPNNRLLALVDQNKEIQVRETAGGTVRQRYPLPDSAKQILSDGLIDWDYRIGFSGDGKELLLGTVSGIVHRWDLAAQKELPRLNKHQGRVTALFTLPDGKTLLTTGEDGLIRRWDRGTGREVDAPDGYQASIVGAAAALSDDGRLCALGDARGRIDLWDAQAGKRLRVLQQEGEHVTRLAFAPDAKTLASGGRLGGIHLWNVAGGPALLSLGRPEKPGLAYVGCLRFSPDGRTLLSCDYARGMQLTDTAGGQALWRARGGLPAAISPDGKTVVADSGFPALRFLDAATGNERFRTPLKVEHGEGHQVARDLAFSPDGRRVAVAFYDGRIGFYDAENGQALSHSLAVDVPQDASPHAREIIRRTNGIHCLTFSPDGKWLVSGGYRGAVRLWEVATARRLLHLDGHEGRVTHVAFGPDGRTVFSCGTDCQAYLLDIRPAPTAAKPSLAALWDDLAAEDAEKLYRAVWAMVDDPKTAASFLRGKVPPAAPVAKGRLAQLIIDLDSRDFAVRNAADKALADLGDLAAPALEEALKEGPSPEVRKRLQGLLDGLKKEATPEELRLQRAVQALELAGAAESRTVLQAWAGGAAAHRLTKDARAAVERLERRGRLGHP